MYLWNRILLQYINYKRIHCTDPYNEYLETIDDLFVFLNDAVQKSNDFLQR